MIQSRHLQRLSLLCPTQVEPQAALEEALNDVWALRVLVDWARINGRYWHPVMSGVLEIRDVGWTVPRLKAFRGRWAMLEAAEWIIDNVPDMYHWRDSR